MSASTSKTPSRPRRRPKQAAIATQTAQAAGAHQAEHANPDDHDHLDHPGHAGHSDRSTRSARSSRTTRSAQSATAPAVRTEEPDLTEPSAEPSTESSADAVEREAAARDKTVLAEPNAATRLLEALDHAAALLGRTASGPIVHGRRGRTAGRRTELPGGGAPAWLRVLTTPVAKDADRRWQGNKTAEYAFGDTFGDLVDRRPRLLDVHDWTDGGYAYRAELTAYVDTPRCSWSPVATAGIDLPDEWWTDLRRTLGIVARARTQRTVVHQDWIDRLVPEQLGFKAPTLRSTAPAHGSLHWSNLTRGGVGPDLLGWGAWGRAPLAYDAAMLHAHSLPVPELAARVRAAFPELDTADGRVAEIVVTAELLHRISRGNHRGLEVLEPHLHAQARRLRPAAHRVPHPRRPDTD